MTSRIFRCPKVEWFAASFRAVLYAASQGILVKIIIPDDGQVASEFLGKAADNDTLGKYP